jgi:hypothetical protein
VELPGIEPDTQIAVTCGNTEIGYAGLRETTQTTCGYAKAVDAINSQRGG